MKQPLKAMAAIMLAQKLSAGTLAGGSLVASLSAPRAVVNACREPGTRVPAPLDDAGPALSVALVSTSRAPVLLTDR